jgi:hypothetical protein
MNPGILVRPSRFQKQHAILAIRTQTICEHTSCGAGANDDKIKACHFSDDSDRIFVFAVKVAKPGMKTKDQIACDRKSMSHFLRHAGW